MQMLFSVGKVEKEKIRKGKSLRNAHSEDERKTGKFRSERAEPAEKKHSHGDFHKLLKNSRKRTL